MVQEACQVGTGIPGIDRQHSAGRSLPAWLPRSREKRGHVQSPGRGAAGAAGRGERGVQGCPAAEGRAGLGAGGLEQNLASIPNAELHLRD